MTVVMLCGALVSGCQGEAWEQPAHEQPEASVAATRQAVISPELEASLACVETYANAGTCDWAHWSEMVETCVTHAHGELEDGLFLEEVQSGHCTAANWPALSEQLITPRPPLVRMRTDCHGGAQVITEVEDNGCYPLAQTAGASYVDVPIGKAVRLFAGVGCTGTAVTVQTDASLCVTKFANGTSTNDKVRSFRVQDLEAPPSEYRYDCAPEESTCVKNHNSTSRLVAINRKHTVQIVRILVAGRSTPSMGLIEDRVLEMYDFFKVASRQQISLEVPLARRELTAPAGSTCEEARKHGIRYASSDAFLTVYSMPTGLCDVSRARSRSISLNGNLPRDHAHETGHVLGLGHGNARNPAGGNDIPYGDASTYMGRFPSDNYNLPQLHWLGWTKKQDLVDVTSAIASKGASYTVTLRPVGTNAEVASDLPLGAVWEIPGTAPKERLFIAMPKSRLNATNDIEGGTVIVYRSPQCENCTGMAMKSTTRGRFNAKSTGEPTFDGLRIQAVSYTLKPVQPGEPDLEDFASVTLRFSRVE
ncbi:metallopeptidase domain-containing protein [Myxococcus qinghaiensis]|uniref:hypothetical protein n=1 Tax=Myxococcus qinghaiensis TaxID=2906758 RepID=UPI0020A8074B|nr:hypothetical protein [Myxococcus qinghaiensis]MCP3162286.1 hypothetical protein [Myxococcus qinghaiensis]